jgi:hypothetical protein
MWGSCGRYCSSDIATTTDKTIETTSATAIGERY